MPAENEPAEPNALTQSLQLTCSLTPSSTEPSTWLVIIWLKRWLARSPIEPPLEPAPVGVGVGLGQDRRRLEKATSNYADGEDVGLGCPSGFAALRGGGRIGRASAAKQPRPARREMQRVAEKLSIVSARTACRWSLPHRPAGSPGVASAKSVTVQSRPLPRSSRRRSRAMLVFWIVILPPSG